MELVDLVEFGKLEVSKQNAGVSVDGQLQPDPGRKIQGSMSQCTHLLISLTHTRRHHTSHKNPYNAGSPRVSGGQRLKSRGWRPRSMARCDHLKLPYPAAAGFNCLRGTKPPTCASTYCSRTNEIRSRVIKSGSSNPPRSPKCDRRGE